MQALIEKWIKPLVAVRKQSTDNYFDVLDGWRGLSILFILATHLLPLGPKAWRLNETAGPIGMALFFTLSGFLITHFLIHKPDVRSFIIRRFFRIIPLAWLYLIVALPFLGIAVDQFLPHFLFYGNYPPMSFEHGTSHFWSLCVEVQFYLLIALSFAMFKERAFYLMVALCVGVTLFRINNGVYIAINTYYRIDEILVGLILALAYNNRIGQWLPNFLGWVNPYIVMTLFVISCHPETAAMNYLRPYLAAILIGSTLYNPRPAWSQFLNLKVLVYLASVSYALYVIHPLLVQTWLGSGDLIEKYAKRPLLFVLLFALAHLSTFYYEKYWIRYAKKLTSR